MSTADFAAAQSRILARRVASASRRPPALPSSAPILPPALQRLPPSLRRVATSSIAAYQNITASASNAPSPHFRVGQVDAELLDEELLSLLRGQVSDALKYFGGHLSDDWSTEIGAVLRAVIWKLSIWDRATSYGASLQGLHYVDARREHLHSIAGDSEATKWQRAAYGVITVGGRYSWQRLEDWLLDRESGYDESTPFVKQVSRLTSWANTTHEAAGLVSFLVFLYNGKYRTLVDRLLQMRLTPKSARTSREVSFEYLNRQLVWHAFTEFLLFLLPLVGIARWRRWLGRAWRKVKSTLSRKADGEDDTAGGELGFLPERTCAICYRDQNTVAGGSEADVMAQSAGGAIGGGVIGSAQTDIANPYEAIPCGCVYCFVCLAQRIEAEGGEGWTCARCGEVVKQCKPWNGDVLEEIHQKRHRSRSRSSSSNSRPGSSYSRKSVVFVDEQDLGPMQRKMSLVDPMPMEDDDIVDSRAGLSESNEWDRPDEQESDVESGCEPGSEEEEEDEELEEE
ncbi:hypothetical protein AAFC00_000331 [Neodothiora populina]|uniref:RING-type E3 ubiquitin transferase (cysteine targeting) n=1 Tax=Neodothiora populina TaxID=2781224 RepID=A0ABR3PCU1_9PEZI